MSCYRFKAENANSGTLAKCLSYRAVKRHSDVDMLATFSRPVGLLKREAVKNEISPIEPLIASLLEEFQDPALLMGSVKRC